MDVKIVKRKLFVNYRGRWMNIALEVQSHGDGFKGYIRFFYHWIRCLNGVHRYGSFCRFAHDDDGTVMGFERYSACMYCRCNEKAK